LPGFDSYGKLASVDSEILLLEELRVKELVELGRIMRGAVVELGREPSSNGILVANEAVSRVHGKISSLGNYWLYEDLGSTNGSWVDGDSVPPGELRFLRSGCMLQLASSVIRVTELSADSRPIVGRGSHIPARSLLVLIGDSLISEYPVPEYGSAVIVGGLKAELEIPGRMNNEPVIEIERKGMFATVKIKSQDVPVCVNGKKIYEVTPLKDGDQVSVDRYTIIFNEPPVTSAAIAAPPPGTAEWNSLARKAPVNEMVAAEDSGGSFLNKPAQSSLFGKPLDMQDEPLEVNETIRIDTSALPRRVGRDYHPSMRSAEVQPESPFDTMEQKLVLIIGFALLIALLLLLILWLFI
jgi:FHA domain